MFISSFGFGRQTFKQTNRKVPEIASSFNTKEKVFRHIMRAKVHKRIRIMVICPFHFKGLSANVQVYIATCNPVQHVMKSNVIARKKFFEHRENL